MAAASLVVRNARIYTAEPSRPWAEALACAGGRLVEVGEDRNVEPLIGAGTEVLDAGGRLVLPGFVDAHVHLIWGYELGTWIDLTDRPSLQVVQRRIAQYAGEHPNEEIILGHGLDYAALKPDGLPRKDELDEAEDRRPVFLTAYDGHTGLGNSRFTERAMAVAAAQGSDVGEMQRDPSSREPTGVFHRAFDLMPLIPEIQNRRSMEGLRRTIAEASRFGITTAFDVQVDLEQLQAYDELREAGGLTVRIRAAIYHPRGTPPGRYLEFAAAREEFNDDWLRVASVKLYIDGVVETGTAALLEPYSNKAGSLGETVYSDKEFRSIILELDRMGFQICTHATGDRGLRIALDAYEEAGTVNGTQGRRHRVEHCEVVAPEDIPRFARLGVVPCMMPRHAAPEILGRWREGAGMARTREGFPWRAFLDSGARMAFASDWPVADLNPLTGVREAVTRRLAEEDWRRRLTVKEAIDGYTTRAAYACHAEDSVGSLSPGKYADMIVLSQDIFQIPPEAIAQAQVVRTIVGGRTVFEEGTGGA